MNIYERLANDNLEGLIVPEWYEEDQKEIDRAERLAENDLVQEQEKWKI